MHLLESVEALALGGHQLTPTVGQNRLQTSLANMSGSCPRHMEKPRQLHGLWEMGGSGVQHLGAGASPGGILIASHFRDLTQQLLKTHSWLVYERRLQCSRLLLQSSHELFCWTGHLLPICVQLSCSESITPPSILLEVSRQLFGRSQESSASP